MCKAAVVLLAVGLLLAGCTAAATPAAPTPTSPPGATTIDSSVAVHRELTAPSGTRSASIRLTCTGSRITLSFGGDLQDRGTTCDAPRSFRMPVTDGALDLDLEPGTGTSFTATVSFSRDAFVADPVLAKECALASTAESDLISADNGLESGQLGMDGAQALVRQAKATLDGGPFDGEAGSELSTPRTWLDANPGADPRHAPLGARLPQLCADNATPITVMSSYGG